MGRANGPDALGSLMGYGNENNFLNDGGGNPKDFKRDVMLSDQVRNVKGAGKGGHQPFTVGQYYIQPDPFITGAEKQDPSTYYMQGNQQYYDGKNLTAIGVSGSPGKGGNLTGL